MPEDGQLPVISHARRYPQELAARAALRRGLFVLFFEFPEILVYDRCGIHCFFVFRLLGSSLPLSLLPVKARWFMLLRAQRDVCFHS